MNRELCMCMFSAAVAVMFALPAGMSFAGVPDGPAGLFLVEHTHPETGQMLVSRGCDIVERYDSLTLTRMTAEQLSAAEKSGLRAWDMSPMSEVVIGDYDFDSDSEPRLPERLRIHGYGSGVEGLFIVQLVGPAKDSWLDRIEELGARTVHFVPLNSFLVSMTEDVKAGVEDLYFVGNVLVCQPAYKFKSGLSSETVAVTLPDWADIQGATAELNGLGLVKDIHSSESMGIVQILVELHSPTAIEEVAAMPMVMRIDGGLVPDVQQQQSETESEIVGGMWASQTPYSTHGSHVNLQGWDGSGIVVAVCDGGIGNGHTGHPDYQDRFMWGYHYWRDAANPDGTMAASSLQAICSHGVHMAGLIGGNGYLGTGVQYPTSTNSQRYYIGTGVAPNCTLTAQRLFTEGNYAWSSETYPRWEGFFNDSHTLGVDICACSFGLIDGIYSLRSSAFDHAVRDCSLTTPGDQPLSVTCSVGNGGPSKRCTEPSTAKNLMAVGGTETCYPDATAHSGGSAANSDNPDQLYTGSQSGTSDNRLKPDCVAPAQTTLSTASQFDSSSYIDDRCYYDGAADYRYYWNVGTSFSSPIGAGSLAVVYQYYKTRYGTEPSPAMAKAMILNSCKDISGTTHGASDIPNYLEGWGRIYLPEAVTPTAPVLRLDRPANLQTGQTYYRNITCDSTGKPLKITLAYTDYQAASGAAKALVNDISLRVTAPNSAVFYGNGFTNGWSSASAYAGNTNYGYDWDDDNNGYDDHNNVEAVFIQSPLSGTYRIEVIANNVVSDSVSATPATDQDFALVCWNAQGGDADISPPAFAGIESAECPGDGTSIRVTWDTGTDWSQPITYLVHRFDHSPSEAEVNASVPLFSGTVLYFDDNTVTKGSTYWYVVRARDSAMNTEHNAVAIACKALPVKYLQVQIPAAGFRSLNLEPLEAGAQTSSTGVISSIGEHMIEPSGGRWLSDAYTQDTDVSGTWTFRLFGKMDNRYTDGYLYATVRRHSDDAVLFTTGYDDENAAGFTAGYHMFEWSHEVSGTTIPAGDRYYVEYRLHVTAVPGASLVKTYDYSSGTHTASYPDSEDTPPYDIGATGSVTLSQIAASEDTRSLSRDPGSIDFVSLQCRMYLAETAAQIDEVEMHFEGKGNPADGNYMAPVEDAGTLALYAWNFATSRWLPVHRDNLLRSSDKVIAGTLNSDTPGFTSWSDYIGAGNEFRWIAHNKVSDMTMLTDYVKITVRKSSSAGAFSAAYDNAETKSSVRHPESAASPPASFGIPVAVGWNLVSTPLIPISQSMPDAFADLDADTVWSVAKYYDSSSPEDPWKTYRAGGTANDLTAVNHKMGIWIYISGAGDLGDGIIRLAGTEPGMTTIQLRAGWNLVGYPSATERTAALALSGTGADMVAVFQTTSPYISDTSDLAAVTMSRGKAYWVRVPADTTWTVIN